jgi:hypothetical protein
MKSCCTLQSTFAGTLLTCCMLQYAFAGSLNHGQMPHFCTYKSDTRVLVQGAEADETNQPSPKTLSPSAKTDKIIPPSDKPDQPSPQSQSQRHRGVCRNQLSIGQSSHCSLYPLQLRNLRYTHTLLVCTSVQCLTRHAGHFHSRKHLL